MRAISTAALSALMLVAFVAAAFAGVTIHNQDSVRYKLLVNSSTSCFSGTHTSIGSNTTSGFSAGWACINEKKPAVKLEDGKKYKIKNGKILPM